MTRGRTLLTLAILGMAIPLTGLPTAQANDQYYGRYGYTGTYGAYILPDDLLLPDDVPGLSELPGAFARPLPRDERLELPPRHLHLVRRPRALPARPLPLAIVGPLAPVRDEHFQNRVTETRGPGPAFYGHQTRAAVALPPCGQRLADALRSRSASDA